MIPNLQLMLWLAQPVLQCGVAAAMFWRKLHRTFPVFFAYTVFQALAFCVLFPLYSWGDYTIYFATYWSCQAVSLILGFKIIHEIFLDVFRPYHALKDLGSVLFKWAALVMLLVAGVVASGNGIPHQGPVVQAIVAVQRCVRVIQCGLILFLLVFARYLGVSRRQHSFGIALGFGAFAAVELAVVALHASGQIGQLDVNMADTVAYDLSIVAWLGYVLMPSAARDASATLLMSQRWNESLSDIQHPVPSDSLIPMFEGMVDRALSRGNGEPAEVAAKAAAAGAGNGGGRAATPIRPLLSTHDFSAHS